MSYLHYPDDPERVSAPGMSPRELSGRFSRFLRSWEPSDAVEYTPEDLFTMHFDAKRVMAEIRRGDVCAAIEVGEALEKLSREDEEGADDLLQRMGQIDSQDGIGQLLLQAAEGVHGDVLSDVMALALIEVANVRATLKVRETFPGWAREC